MIIMGECPLRQQNAVGEHWKGRDYVYGKRQHKIPSYLRDRIIINKSGLNAEISSAAKINMQDKIVNMLDPQSHHNPNSKRWHTRYDPTMKHSHCETVYAKELFQWLFLELVRSLRILSILPTFKLDGLTKECQWCTYKAAFDLVLK